MPGLTVLPTPAPIDTMIAGLRELIAQCGLNVPSIPAAIWPEDRSWIISAKDFGIVSRISDEIGFGRITEIHLYHPDHDVVNALPLHLREAGYTSAQLVTTTHTTAIGQVHNIRAVRLTVMHLS